jgi:uncharacterized protein (TIGR02217 family)
VTLLASRLPTTVEVNAIRRDVEDIEIVTTDGLWEVRNARHSQSLREWDISFPAGSYSGTTIAAVIAMFKAARGALYPFRFKDPIDNSATLEAFGTGDGTTATFQLRKNYTVGSDTHQRTITRPIAAVSIYKNDVLQTTGYTVDYTTGAVLFSSIPAAAAALKWSGSFDIPVRFDTPLGATAIDYRTMHIDTLTLKEIRE